MDAYIVAFTTQRFHVNVMSLQSIWNILFKTKSSMERGTLFQLRNLINRRNVTSKPKSDVNATEDFFELVVTGYIIAAAMSHLKMQSQEGIPDSSIVPEDTWMQDDAVRAKILTDVSRALVDKFVNLDTVFAEQVKEAEDSTVFDYTCQVITLGLLYLNFKDAVREGDGDRDITVWKYFMLIWMATGHKNYSVEAFTLLSQYYLFLPPNQAAQLKWSRFINVHGLPGHNISCDLHMEHLNRLIKTAMEGLGSNKKQKKAMKRVGKAVGVLASLTKSFDEEVGVSKPSGKHAKKNWDKDMEMIVKELLGQAVFDEQTKRTHKSFTKMKKNIISKIKETKLKDWMREKVTMNT